MREGWTYKRLLDECSILYGYPFDSKCFSSSNEDMPLIRIRDVKEGHTSTYYSGDYPNEYIIHKGDYLIGMDGEFNISPWQSEDALLNQRVCKIESKNPDILMRYVYRFLIKELKKIEDETPFVTVKHLSAKKLNQIILPLPPLSEQQRIVSELDLLSSIIEKKKAQLKEYDQLAQSIFYDMFGDPVTNEKGWEKASLSKMGLLARGVSKHRPRNAPELLGGTMPLIQTGDVSNADFYIRNYNSTYSELGVSQSKIWKAGTLCITIAATIGKCAILSFDACFPDSVVGFTVNNKLCNNEYVFFIFKCLQSILEENAPSVAQKNINLKVLNDLELPLPPLPLQQSFASKIEAIERQKALIQQSIAEVQMLFDSRMDDWFA